MITLHQDAGAAQLHRAAQILEYLPQDTASAWVRAASICDAMLARVDRLIAAELHA